MVLIFSNDNVDLFKLLSKQLQILVHLRDSMEAWIMNKNSIEYEKLLTIIKNIQFSFYDKITLVR